MSLHLSEKEAAAFFAQIKRPMPVTPQPIQPVIKPERPRKARKAVRLVKEPTIKRPRLSYALGYSSTAIRAVRPQWWFAAMILGYLVIRAVFETPTF